MTRSASIMQFVPQAALAAILRGRTIWRTIAGVLLACLAAWASPASAQIYNWNTGQVIPGTQGITPGPGVDLSGWNTPGHQLEFADLDSINLTAATFATSDLTSAGFYRATLTNANFTNANLTNTDLQSSSPGQ